MSDAASIVAEGDLVIDIPSTDVSQIFKTSDEEDRHPVDSSYFPDNMEKWDRVYFASDGLIYGEATYREMGSDYALLSGGARIAHTADCPVDVPEGGSALIQEDGVLPVSDRDVNTDTVVDTEEWR